MDLDIRYVVDFSYPSPVWESQNAARMCPVDDERQRLHSYRLSVDPAARLTHYVDHWGTRVDEFGVTAPHSTLTVVADSRVTTAPSSGPPDDVAVGVVEGDYRWDLWRFLRPSRHTEAGAALRDAAREIVAGASGVIEASGRIVGAVRDRLTYEPGATDIGVDVDEVWNGRAGVCQDFAHLTIAMLRSVGIAGRYVSGYLYAADPETGAVDTEGELTVQTHAWVEVGLSERSWWSVDPANGSPVGEQHVVIGRGRDYDDVTPLRGVYFGETEHSLVASVHMVPSGSSSGRSDGASQE